MKTAIDQKTILDVMNKYGDQFLEWEGGQLKKSIEQSLARHRATQQQPPEQKQAPVSRFWEVQGGKQQAKPKQGFEGGMFNHIRALGQVQ